MSVNTPPDPNVSTFNNAYWTQADQSITKEYADLHYLKYPIAQGTETLKNIIVTGTAAFNSTSAPTSNQTLLSTTDNSNKIPTTAWVQSVVNTYTVKYTTNQTITTPANCRAIDILLIGAGGAAGIIWLDAGTLYYGGSGSGGNAISASNIPMAAGEQLVLTFSLTSTTGATTLTRGGVTLASAYNGSKGQDATSGSGNRTGGPVNTTVGIGNTALSSWYNTFGSAGDASTVGGTAPPDMSPVSVACPPGASTWTNGGFGMGQQWTNTTQGPGLCVITYHLAI